jgi:dTDP-4-dehydrorhamnose 3,5-epimerase
MAELQKPQGVPDFARRSPDESHNIYATGDPEQVFVEATPLSGVWKASTPLTHHSRGLNRVIHINTIRLPTDDGVVFVQDNVSISNKGVLRGVHGDYRTWKWISCLYGKIYFVVVDCRSHLPTYGRWHSWILEGDPEEDYGTTIIVPPGFGNGHYILSEKAVFHYKNSASYDQESQFTIRYDDPEFNIEWPIDGTVILSDRDNDAI